MTTRITLSILLTTWIILVLGEAGAYFIARQSLIALLDDALITRAAHVLEQSGDVPGNTDPTPATVAGGDRYEIRDQWGNLTSRSTDTAGNGFRPVLIYAGFRKRDDGTPVRVITLRTLSWREKGKREPITITYSRPSARFSRLLEQLAFMLVMIGLACGLTTAWLALKLSRSALRPLRETADAIARIDEKNLSRRIEDSRLPAELVPMTHRLNELLARLEEVFRERKQFLADAAHELRTPIASLLTTLEVSLRRPRDASAMNETLHSALDEARRLRKLAEQLMEHARGEHTGMEAVRRSDVAALLRECVAVVGPLAREKGVELSCESPDELFCVTQPDRVRSIVLNLLSNAIEYNQPGGNVRLSAALEGGALRLEVTDTGRGIAAEQLAQIFQPFYRGGHGGRGDDPSHMGLGLFLVRSHADALGGRCDVQSAVDEGTTITITLPVAGGTAKESPTATGRLSKAVAVSAVRSG